ncbi:MAG: Amidase enhancer [Candidatus Magasanikbacteria bacterium GW2011_GWA2_37_8]|uniref:Amidase enhancer n=1 Tax=Candidatus Magasanikbacteria bacterium GW2011_GWA2_37_8 TaxID=1619036 RepID=A0A0G0KKN2_9BACT|nr:MAG: Amidase enhancer [Candidatus Magasanikbacteria bacterium GW2011_GWA2_37_8]
MLKRFLTLFVTFFCFIVFVPPVKAAGFVEPVARDKTFSGKYVSQTVSDPIEIPAGEYKDVVVKIKNTGKSVWANVGPNYVSAYTVDPNYHNSKLAGKNWLAKDQPAKISATTKPGQIAEIKIRLYAPTKIGDYKEDFYLVSENKTWIAGTHFYLKVKAVAVKPKVNVTSVSDDNIGNSGLDGQDESELVNKEYNANLVAFSARSISAGGGEQVKFIVRYLNAGTVAWDNYSWQEAGSRPTGDSTTRVNITDPSWQSIQKITGGDSVVKPGDPLEVVYLFRLPAKQGNYIARFQLTANNHTLVGGTLELPITVTSDAPSGYQETVFSSARVLINEPTIRIGLYKTTDEVEFISSFPYKVYSGEVLKGDLPAGTKAMLNYSNGVYGFFGAGLDFTEGEKIRLVPYDPQNYFTLVNYDRKVSWKGAKNFNMYRGTFEYVYSPKSSMPYIVNELPLDEYIAGIGETSSGAAMEYIKAILVAARSYAYYNINNGLPASQRTFDVYATTVDQLYLGYNSEVLMPRVVQAEQATYGEMVTYNSTVVTTPYFGHSDGRTRLWSEAWGGTDKPWLQPVDCKYDEGQSMFGHGVGMSAADAAARADKDGWTYDQLLKYYYTGVQVEKIY